MTGYSPETLDVMQLAFEKSWATLKSRYKDPEAMEAARLLLASAIVDVAPPVEAQADDVARMAVDLFMILKRGETASGQT